MNQGNSDHAKQCAQRRPLAEVSHHPVRRVDYACAVGSVVVATAVSMMLEHVLPLGNLSLVFLTSVLVVAARTGIRPALFTAALSFLTYNFFFTEPRFTLHMADTDELLTVVFFLMIAVIGGNLSGRLRDQVKMLRASNDLIDALLQFTRRLASAPDVAAVQSEAVESLYSQLHIPVMIATHSSGTGTIVMVVERGVDQPLNEAENSAIDWAIRNENPAGHFLTPSKACPGDLSPSKRAAKSSARSAFGSTI